MNIERVKKEIAKREKNIKKLEEENEKIKKTLSEVFGDEYKKRKTKLDDNEFNISLELAAIKRLYEMLYNTLDSEINDLEEEIKTLDPKTVEYANKIIKLDELKNERKYAKVKIDALDSNKSKKVVAVEEGTPETIKTSCRGWKILTGTLALILGLACLKNCDSKPLDAIAAVFVTSPNNDGNNNNKDNNVYTDPTNPSQLEARAKWYLENYDIDISYEELIDILSVCGNELPVDGKFEDETLKLLFNHLAESFIFLNSTKTDENNGTRKYVPLAPLFPTDERAYKCASDLDEIMGPLITAMNNNNNKKVVEYTKKFGNLVIEQFVLPTNTGNHLGVRGLMPSSQALILFFADYTLFIGDINDYCVNNGLNICIKICDDYITGQPVEISLSYLMEMLKSTPMCDWNVALKRAGISADMMTNNSATKAMPDVLMEEAKNDFRDKQAQMRIGKGN